MKQMIDEAKEAIERWEGLFQAMPEDAGNWVNGVNVGTMRGVTPAVLARYRGVPKETITRQTMMTVTLDEAASIYVRMYIQGPRLDQLFWGPTVGVIADIGWGSGPVVGVRAAQLLSGAQVDGQIGPQTATTFTEWLRRVGHAQSVEALESWRKAFYRRLIDIRPANARFLQGWLNRANWYSAVPPTPWWNSWQPLPDLAEPPLPVENVQVTEAELPELPPMDMNRSFITETGAEIGWESLLQAENDALDMVLRSIPVLGPAIQIGRQIAGMFTRA